jgi:hypothetical protein
MNAAVFALNALGEFAAGCRATRHLTQRQRSFSASLAAEPWRVEPPHHRNYRWSTGSRFSKRFWKSKLKSFAGDTAIILI